MPTSPKSETSPRRNTSFWGTRAAAAKSTALGRSALTATTTPSPGPSDTSRENWSRTPPIDPISYCEAKPAKLHEQEHDERERAVGIGGVDHRGARFRHPAPPPIELVTQLAHEPGLALKSSRPDHRTPAVAGGARAHRPKRVQHVEVEAFHRLGRGQGDRQGGEGAGGAGPRNPEEEDVPGQGVEGDRALGLTVGVVEQPEGGGEAGRLHGAQIIESDPFGKGMRGRGTGRRNPCRADCAAAATTRRSRSDGVVSAGPGGGATLADRPAP